MKPPFKTTRTFLELYRVFLVDIEESIQLAKNGCGVSFVRIQFAIKNLLCGMDRIGDNNDFWHILFSAGLVDAASNSE